MENVADYFNGVLKKAAGFELKTESRPVGHNAIQFELLADSVLADEGYRLRVNSHKIVVEANNSAGCFLCRTNFVAIVASQYF